MINPIFTREELETIDSMFGVFDTVAVLEWLSALTSKECVKLGELCIEKGRRALKEIASHE